MKIRSTPLYTYLFETGALNGTSEEIDSAKRQYRRLYKKRWKQFTRQKKEIRFDVSAKQFEKIKAKAMHYNITHTAYVRAVLLDDASNSSRFILADDLLPLLQVISIAANGAARQSLTHSELFTLLSKAENVLLTHIKKMPNER